MSAWPVPASQLHVADSLTDLVALFDASGTCVYMNRPCRRRFRIAPTDAVDAIRLAELPPASESDRLRAALGVVSSGQAWTGALDIEPPGATAFPSRSTLAAVEFDDGSVGVAWTARDTTTDREVIKSLSQRAFYDPVTGLSHRSLFLDRLDLLLRTRSTTNEHDVGVLVIAPDRFKERLSRFEHSATEGLLRSIGARIADQLSHGQSAHRWGDADFVVLLERTAHDDALAVADRLVRAFEAPIIFGDRSVVLPVTAGVTLASPGTVRLDEVIRHADVAGQSARTAGGGAIRVFDESTRARNQQRADLEDDLWGAAARGELELHYQPEVLLRTGQIVGCEALLRWRHPRRGLVSPAEFIPVAEASNLIIELGDWVLREALRASARWSSRAGVGGHFTTAVNISSRQFGMEDFTESLASLVRETGASPQHLCLEITETVLLADADDTVHKLQQLKEMGVQLAIDDFGTGYSSLSYLRRFPVDILKVDRSFVSGLGHDPEDSAIVQAVVHMGKALRMTTLAEGVETPHQVIELRELDCDLAQGFHYAPPMPAEEFTRLLDAGEDWLEARRR